MMVGSASVSFSKLSARLIRVSTSVTEAQTWRKCWMKPSKAGKWLVAVAGMLNPGQACSNVATPFSDCYRFVAVAVNGF